MGIVGPMPTIKCDSNPCPLRTEVSKFCPDCGALASAKVVPDNTCLSCSFDFKDTTPKFCPECGHPSTRDVHVVSPLVVEPTTETEAPEKLYGSLDQLIRQHEETKARQTPMASKGRGLTAEEMARLERGMRKPADRTYVAPSSQDASDYQSVSSLDVPLAPDTVDKLTALHPRREGLFADPGKHSPGSLSAKGTKLEPDYHLGVRVIPYSFRHAARNGRRPVSEGTKTEGEGSPMEDGTYFTDDSKE